VAKTQFAKNAVQQHVDLSPFKEKPSTRLLTGLVLIALSFVIAWPAISVCGIVAFWLQEPMVIVIGGPGFYALSWLVWGIGMFLAGTENVKYAKIFLGWWVRRFVSKHGRS
jgi:hypothetical protein